VNPDDVDRADRFRDLLHRCVGEMRRDLVGVQAARLDRLADDPVLRGVEDYIEPAELPYRTRQEEAHVHKVGLRLEAFRLREDDEPWEGRASALV